MHLTEEELIDHVLGETNVHVAACAACRNDAKILGYALALTRDVPPPPEGHFEKIWNEVEWRLLPRPSRQTPPASLMATAATLVLVLAAAVIWVMMTRPQPQTPNAVVVKTPAPSVPQTTVVPPPVQMATAPPQQAARRHAAPPRAVQEEKAPTNERRFTILPGGRTPSPANPDRDADDLAAIARNSKSLHERIDAINALSLASTQHADENLQVLYREEEIGDIRRAIVHALYIRMSKSVLKSLMSQETDPEMRQQMEEAIRQIERRERKQYLTGWERQ